MRHPIDPKVDCVFKALLGAEANRGLLIHFLNAILGAALPGPITAVEILNPYNEREFLDDKLSVVDVKARDATGGQYQIEVQLLAHRDLPARILYGWADLYSAQLQSGQDYAQLRPTYAVWLLGESVCPDLPGYAHDLQWRDAAGRVFLAHGGIWLLELRKFSAARVATEQERWLKFFLEAESLDETDLPQWMQTPEMRQAMTTLKTFSEKERAYHAYQARQNYQRIQRSIEGELDHLRRAVRQAQETVQQERAALEQERAAKEEKQAALEQERAAKEALMREVERLQAQLAGQDRTVGAD